MAAHPPTGPQPTDRPGLVPTRRRTSSARPSVVLVFAVGTPGCRGELVSTPIADSDPAAADRRCTECLLHDVVLVTP